MQNITGHYILYELRVYVCVCVFGCMGLSVHPGLPQPGGARKWLTVTTMSVCENTQCAGVK